MAQVKIYGLRRALAPLRDALSGAIHDAVMAAFALPPEKRFHRFILLDDSDLFFPDDRSERYVIIELSVFEGRSVVAKKQLIKGLIANIGQRVGIAPHDVEITIFETPRGNWGIRGLPGDELTLNYSVSQ